MTERGEREIMGLLLRTQAESVADVVRGHATGSSFSVAAAITAARSLARLVEDTLHVLVRQARAEGSSWREIGDLLGTSKQAAQQRFGSSEERRAMTEGAEIPGAGDKALDILTAYREGRWSDVRAEFSERMLSGLTEEMLSGTATQLASFGAIVSIGEPVIRKIGDHTVVDVPVAFERGELKGRVAFRSDARVDGFFLLDPSEP